jgi:hypothetical protein
MKLSMNLTLDGLAIAETKPGKTARDERFALIDEAATRQVAKAGKGVSGDGF